MPGRHPITLRCLFALLALLASASGLRGEATVDVLVLYTNRVQEHQGGADGIRAYVNSLIANTNQALANSAVRGKLRLARMEEADYNEYLSDTELDLDRLSYRYDGIIDEIFDLREAWDADLVCLLTSHDAEGPYYGIANLLYNTEGDPLAVFSVVDVDAPDGWTVFAHEIGHNLGAAHDRENAGGEGLFSYSYGYRFFGSDNFYYRTLMAYFPGRILSQYSNPNILYMGVPTGLQQGNPLAADNVSTFNYSMPLIAQYRRRTHVFFSSEASYPDEHAQSFSLPFSTDVDWKVDSWPGWITFDPASGPAGNAAITINVSENTGPATRTGNLVINGTTHTITQEGTGLTDDDDFTDFYLTQNANPLSGNPGNGWYWNYWFGFFSIAQRDWVFHQDYGWVYVNAAGNSESSAWIYIANQGRWFWTSNALEDGVTFDSALGSFAFWDSGTQAWWPF